MIQSYKPSEYSDLPLHHTYKEGKRNDALLTGTLEAPNPEKALDVALALMKNFENECSGLHIDKSQTYRTNKGIYEIRDDFKQEKLYTSLAFTRESKKGRIYFYLGVVISGRTVNYRLDWAGYGNTLHNITFFLFGYPLMLLASMGMLIVNLPYHINCMFMHKGIKLEPDQIISGIQQFGEPYINSCYRAVENTRAAIESQSHFQFKPNTENQDKKTTQFRER